MDSVKRVVE